MLKTIFSFFLGLMLTTFLGVGVYTFHPPNEQFTTQIRDLGRREQAINTARPTDQLSTADLDQIQAINRERDALVDADADARKRWGRSTSIILIVLATLAMAVSLVRADILPVISNGVLLGGVFTMLYGVGWIVVSGTSISRFLVMSVAVVITVGIGYVRFVRTKTALPPREALTIPVGEGFADIERRVRALEVRIDAAAYALTLRGDRSNAS